MTISHINGVALTTLSAINGITKANVSAKNGQTLAAVGPFLSDTFTDTAETVITSHSPETGGTWTLHPSHSPATPSKINNGGNALYAPAASGVYYNNTTPSSANYHVIGVFTYITFVPTDNHGIAGRMQTGGNTMYVARWQSAGNWQLLKLDGGAATSLGTWAETFNTGSRTVKLEMNGSAIKVFIDGVERISATDSAISAAGYAGVRIGTGTPSTSTGLHISNIEAQTL